MDWKKLGALAQPPRAFDPLDGPFWSDPYIGRHTVYAHLNEKTDDASRPGPQIAAEEAWIDGLIPPRSRILDLGCGPGLYALPLARRGHQVLGWDINPFAVAWAREEARRQDLPHARFEALDFLTAPLPRDLDLVLLIYGILGTLSAEEEALVWRKAWDALKPGGLLVFDVFTQAYWEKEKKKEPPSRWFFVDKADFWTPDPHLVLTSLWEYPEERTFGRVYTILTPDGPRGYPFWYRWHETADYRLRPHWSLDLRGNLSGSLREESGDWLAVIARKQP